MEPLHATIEEFAAEGYTHVKCFCPRCRVIRLRPISWLPRISMELTLDALARRLRCAECGGSLQSVEPWRQADMLGKPQGRPG
jgi:phage FluMu protein Com